MSIRTIVFVGSIVAGLPLGPNAASAADVIKIKASNCTLAPRVRALTGFILRDTVGVITALHGVADCSQIIALSSAKAVSLEMKVTKQSVTHDLAILEPVDPAKLVELGRLDPFDGIASLDAINPGDGVAAVGFPHGVLTPQANDRLRIGTPKTERLGDILGDKNQDLVTRRSPDTNLQVIKVSGLIVKGESGAPLVMGNAPGRVVGVVIGSADPGASNIGWVAPITSMQWNNFSVAMWGAMPLPNALASSVGVSESSGPRSYLLTLSRPGEPDVQTTLRLGTNGEVEQITQVAASTSGAPRAVTVTDPTSGAVVARASVGQNLQWQAADGTTHRVSTAAAGNAVAVGVVSRPPMAPTNLRIVQ